MWWAWQPGLQGLLSRWACVCGPGPRCGACAPCISIKVEMLPCQYVLIRCCGFFGKIHLILLAFCKWRYILFAVLCEQHHVYLFSSVAQSCPTLCDPMDCSMPGFPVCHQLLEVTQTLVHLVGDAIQPSHPLLSPSPPAFSLSQHVYTQDLFTVSGISFCCRLLPFRRWPT